VFNKRFLADVKRKALRRRVWFSALDRVERGIFTLTGRLVDRVRSTALCVELVKILVKIKDALKSSFVKQMENYGMNQVKKLVAQALAWGNSSARTWTSGLEYVRYLTFIHVNRSMGLGI